MYPSRGGHTGKDTPHKSANNSSGRSNLTALINQFKADDQLIRELTAPATTDNNSKGRVLPARPDPRESLRPTSRLGFADRASSESLSSAAFEVKASEERKITSSREPATETPSDVDMLKWKYDKNNNNRKEVSRTPVSCILFPLIRIFKSSI